MVEQVRFVAGVWSLNEEELKKNLEYFKVPSTNVEPIRTKAVMKIFDECANILKGMYSIRFNGRSDHGDTSVLTCDRVFVLVSDMDSDLEGTINLFFMSIIVLLTIHLRIVLIPLPNHHHSYKEH